MEALVAQITTAGPNELASLHTVLKGSEGTLSQSGFGAILRALGGLDPANHSLGYLYFL